MGISGDLTTVATITDAEITGGDYNSLSMLTIALIGFALAYIYYTQNKAGRLCAPPLLPPWREMTTMSSKLPNGTTGYKLTKARLPADQPSQPRRLPGWLELRAYAAHRFTCGSSFRSSVRSTGTTPKS